MTYFVPVSPVLTFLQWSLSRRVDPHRGDSQAFATILFHPRAPNRKSCNNLICLTPYTDFEKRVTYGYQSKSFSFLAAFSILIFLVSVETYAIETRNLLIQGIQKRLVPLFKQHIFWLAMIFDPKTKHYVSLFSKQMQNNLKDAYNTFKTQFCPNPLGPYNFSKLFFP